MSPHPNSHPIMIALDVADTDIAYNLIHQLRGYPCWLKVGMELYYSAGPDFIRRIKHEGYPIFLDLKLHDIPNTVRRASSVVAKLGVDMLNVHAAGGLEMMRSALAGVREVSDSTKVIAVTQLTSTDEGMLKKEIGIDAPLQDIVIRYAKLAKEAGLQGVVSSAAEASSIKSECGPQFLTITPGIRLAGSLVHDQKRVLTPLEAIRNGADYLVIGRTITESPSPRDVLSQILAEINS
jgi:orotidine-5'-phosphate decarboxylase